MLIHDCFKYDVFEDKLYIGNTTEGCYFFVYDDKGNLVHEIDIPYEKRKIFLQDKKKYLSSLEKEFGEKKYKAMTNRFDYKFPKYFPAFSDFILSSAKIYTLGFEKDGYVDVIIIDLYGNILRKAKIPSFGIKNEFYTIHENKFYYLFYNETTFKMELHMERIK